MPSNHSISLRFIRKEDFSENSGKKDDYAKIKYLGKGSYSIEYAHRYQGQSQNTTVLVNETGAMTWVRSMLNLIPLDMEPFYRIQVDLPHFPSVLLTTKDLAHKQYEIMEAIRFSLENYPLPPRIVTQEVREENGEEEEDESEEEESKSEEEEEEEEDYSDMPPLTADDMPTPTFTPTGPNSYTYAFHPPYQGRHLFLDHEEATSAVTH
jgi:hypothetical protein